MQVPYVHFETDENVQNMKEKIALAQKEAKYEFHPGHSLGYEREKDSEKASERHHR
jgi:hypothetical protein